MYEIFKKLDEIYKEEQINEKASAGKVKSALFGDKRGLIRTFAILTAENPMSKKLPDLQNRQRNNQLKKLIRDKRDTTQKGSGLSKEDYFRKLHIQYIPIEGHFEGNLEHSYIVLNLPLSEALYLATKFEQEAFFYGKTFPDDTAEVSYYARDTLDEDFTLIETSNRIDDASDFEDFFSKYGDIKWSFYMKVFNEQYVPWEIKNEKAFEESFDETLTGRGRAEARIWAYKGKPSEW